MKIVSGKLVILSAAFAVLAVPPTAAAQQVGVVEMQGDATFSDTLKPVCFERVIDNSPRASIAQIDEVTADHGRQVYVDAKAEVRAVEGPITFGMPSAIDANSRQIQIVAREQGNETLRRTGFVRVECDRAGLGSPAAKRAWRDEICELASVGNAAVQAQLARAYGQSPGVLCANAELATELWDGKRRKFRKPIEKIDAAETVEASDADGT